MSGVIYIRKIEVDSDIILRNKFSAFELDIILSMAMLFDLDTPFSTHEFEVEKFKQFSMKNYGSIYSKVLAGMKGILSKELSYVDLNIDSMSRLMSAYKRRKGKGIIQIEIPSDTKLVLQNIKNRFNAFPGSIASYYSLSSVYSKRMYEIGLSILNAGNHEVTFSLSELRAVLNAEESYSLFHNFEVRVLKAIEKEINKVDEFGDKCTNMTITYFKDNEGVKGVSVGQITFKFEFNSGELNSLVNGADFLDEVLDWKSLFFTQSEKNKIYKTALKKEKKLGINAVVIVHRAIKQFEDKKGISMRDFLAFIEKH